MFFQKAKPAATAALPLPEPMHPLLVRGRRFARWTDAAWTIPVIRLRVGLDPILNLIPWAGDLIGMTLSCYLIGVALHLQMPPRIFFWMVVNILIDFAIGAVPMAGSVLDAFFKSNLRNIELLEDAYRAGLHRNKAGDPAEPVTIDITPAATPAR